VQPGKMFQEIELRVLRSKCKGVRMLTETSANMKQDLFITYLSISREITEENHMLGHSNFLLPFFPINYLLS